MTHELVVMCEWWAMEGAGITSEGGVANQHPSGCADEAKAPEEE